MGHRSRPKYSSDPVALDGPDSRRSRIQLTKVKIRVPQNAIGQVTAALAGNRYTIKNTERTGAMLTATGLTPYVASEVFAAIHRA